MGSSLGTFDASSLQAATQTCKSVQACTYYVWDGDAHKAELCASAAPAFTRSGPRQHVAVGVKAAMFAAPGFSVATNYQAVCEASQIVDEVRGVYDLGAAADKCAARADCTHFTLSTVAGLDGLTHSQANSLWMCSGAPTLVYHSGWLSAAKPGILPPHLPADVATAFDGPSI